MSEELETYRKVKFLAKINFHSLPNSIQQTFEGEQHEFVIFPNREVKKSFFCRLHSGEVVVINPNDELICEISIFGRMLEFEFIEIGNEVKLWAGKEVACGEITKILEVSEKQVPKMKLNIEEMFSARELLIKSTED